MLLEYISTILWPFALKCCEDCLNNLVHCADDQMPYEMLASLASSKIIVSNFHTFGCPCYVLDHRLQSGNGAVLKWEPHAQMGICVGQSPSHASNVALIFNLRTGHISPQFHIVFDDDFTTVKYLCTGTVPPHWADLVYIPLPRFRCILKSKWEPGNQVQTWKQIKETSQAKINLCVLPIKM
jgi:hypothetical protein